MTHPRHPLSPSVPRESHLIEVDGIHAATVDRCGRRGWIVTYRRSKGELTKVQAWKAEDVVWRRFGVVLWQ